MQNQTERYKALLERIEIQLSTRTDPVIRKLCREIHEALKPSTEAIEQQMLNHTL